MQPTITTSIRGLHTDIALPETSPLAVLIVRTPYNARAHLAEARQWARLGIAAVIQDVRGRHRSPGRFRPYTREATDGLATLEWVTGQNWCRAPVILYGASYGAHCAVEAAVAARAAGINSVGGVSVAVPALGLGETARTIDGSFYLESRVGWWLEHGDGATSSGSGIPDGLLTTLPISTLGLRINPPITAWDSVLGAERRDAERAEQVSTLTCPLLAIGGIRDWFTHDTVNLWTSWGGPASLVLGPWDHSLLGSHRAEHMKDWIKRLLDDSPTSGALIHGLRGGIVRLTRWPTLVDHHRLPGGRFRSDPLHPFPSVSPGADLTEICARSDCLTFDIDRDTGPIIGTPSVRIDSDFHGHWGALLAIRRQNGCLEQVAHGMSPNPIVHLTPTATFLNTGETMVLILAAHSFPRHARDLHTGDDHLSGTATRSVVRDVAGLVLEMPA